ncbi:MAG: dolichyl-phosphate-mannose--protein mannosyltransferase [Rhodoluna sp.]
MVTLLRNKTQMARFMPVLILALAAFLRLFGLGFPNSLVFDETYYVKDAFSLLQHGVELNWLDGSDSQFAQGDTSGLTTEPSFVVHPPLGKWLISLGILIFGPANPLGWRIVVALLGIATVWLGMKCAERIFESKLWANLTGFLLAIDGVGIVLSRTALLDQILGFFALLAFFFLLKDLADTSRYRPWLIAMGISLGLATSVKWSGLYFLAVFTLYRFLVSGSRNYRMHKKLESETGKLDSRLWLRPTFFEGIKTVFFVTVPAATVYLLSWTGWFLSKSGWDRNYAESNPASGFLALLPKPLQSWWHYHVEIYGFHANLHSSHPYEANPLSWIFMLRPTSFFWEEKTGGCLFGSKTSECVSAITSLGNPIIWWGAVLASSVLIGSWFRTRDRVRHFCWLELSQATYLGYF